MRLAFFRPSPMIMPLWPSRSTTMVAAILRKCHTHRDRPMSDR
jgi:hypothetical protein